MFSHGWPLTADAWDDQLFLVASNGYRAIAHDRRGGGRSGQPWDGNDLDTYIGRHGTSRLAKVLLLSAIPPLMLKTGANPEGLLMEVFDGLRAGLSADRSQFYEDLSAPFYGANRPGSTGCQATAQRRPPCRPTVVVSTPTYM